MPESITLFHLSDVQFGRDHRFGHLAPKESSDATFDTLFQRLSDDVAIAEKDGVHPDLVVVSGDLAQMGKKDEFADALEFLTKVADRLRLTRDRVVLVPGNHDINRKLSESYFASCEGEDQIPRSPFWPKWKHYRSLFEQFYSGYPTITFSEERPWTLYTVNDLRVAVAAFNSTMAESHLDNSHFGQLGELQLRWFAERLARFRDRGWLRIGVVHHNVMRAAADDEENLRDADLLQQIVGPVTNCILHGHIHKDGLHWIDSNVPVISTGSASLKAAARPEDVGNQYQILRFDRAGFERRTRRYDSEQRRWIADTRSSDAGDTGITRKAVPFAYVHGTFGSASSGIYDTTGEVFALEERRIVRVDEPLDADSARRRLRGLPRFLLRPENQHRAVRKTEQDALVTLLRRKRAAWLVSDWGLGKDGFLASALERLGGQDALADVFRLECGSVTTCDELLAEAETQLGLSFTEFAAGVAALPAAVLVFDNLPQAVVTGTERENFERKVRPIFEFGPSLRLIFVARQAPRATASNEIVRLLPLEEPELRDYLRTHSRAQPGLDGPDEVDRIYAWSGGLPMHLDRLLERFPFIPLSQILDEDVQLSVGSMSEPLSPSLKQDVARLSDTEERHSRKSFRLLKVLTVLRDGETFQSIRHFYREPFYQTNIDELISLTLLEDVTISQTAADLSVRPQRFAVADPNAPKLLRVPRQVRDYVNTLLSAEERNEIIRTSMGLFFGADWWNGKVRLRRTIANAYGQSAIAGPGNEHVIARHLLAKALEARNQQRITRFADVALAYCYKLMDADRFRDAQIAAGAIADLLRDTDFDKQFVEAAHIHGRALRMMGNQAAALDVVNEALRRGAAFLIDDHKAEIHLTLALIYKALDRTEEALEAAREVIKLAHPESGEAIQAQATIANLTLEGAERRRRLVRLEGVARSRDRKHAANNIALDLARESNEPNESLKWLQKVITSARDPYNRTRAIVEKASVLGANLRASELRDEDYRLLSAAYSYSYAQRIGNLLDRCHTVLWGMFRRAGLLASLLRLFRFSSFIWRLRGTDEQEIVYLQELDSVDIAKLEISEGQTLHVEIHYLQCRRQGRPDKLDDVA